MLRGLDALVFDIQDVGARFYTYETTMAYAMEAAAKAGIPFYVLDRPNPITGTHVEGPLLDAANTSFVGYFAGLPVRHGMTMGELARLFNGENKIGAALTVIPMQDWNRGDWFDSTGPAVDQSVAQHAQPERRACCIRGCACWSIRRTIRWAAAPTRPSSRSARDFIGGRELAAYLNGRQIPGVRVYATSFTPTESNFKGVRIEGVRFVITNRELLDSTRLGLELAAAFQKLYPGKIDLPASKRLIGSDDVIRRLQAGDDPRAIRDSLADPLAAFARERAPYLLYPEPARGPAR